MVAGYLLVGRNSPSLYPDGPANPATAGVSRSSTAVQAQTDLIAILALELEALPHDLGYWTSRRCIVCVVAHFSIRPLFSGNLLS